MLYRDEFLKEISFPIGGIGSGCIGLAGNGRLVDWEILENHIKIAVTDIHILRCAVLMKTVL